MSSPRVVQDTFALFYQCEVKRIVLYLRKNGATWPDAWDAAHNAFEKALTRWDSLHDPSAWMRVTAYRELIDMYRLKETATRAARRSWVRPAFADEELKVGEEELFVIETIRQLPPTQRLVLAWYIDGFSPSEVARHLGMEPGTVRVNLHHARKRLQSELTGENAGGEK